MEDSADQLCIKIDANAKKSIVNQKAKDGIRLLRRQDPRLGDNPGAEGMARFGLDLAPGSVVRRRCRVARQPEIDGNAVVVRRRAPELEDPPRDAPADLAAQAQDGAPVLVAGARIVPTGAERPVHVGRPHRVAEDSGDMIVSHQFREPPFDQHDGLLPGCVRVSVGQVLDQEPPADRERRDRGDPKTASENGRIAHPPDRPPGEPATQNGADQRADRRQAGRPHGQPALHGASAEQGRDEYEAEKRNDCPDRRRKDDDFKKQQDPGDHDHFRRP